MGSKGERNLPWSMGSKGERNLPWDNYNYAAKQRSGTKDEVRSGTMIAKIFSKMEIMDSRERSDTRGKTNFHFRKNFWRAIASYREFRWVPRESEISLGRWVPRESEISLGIITIMLRSSAVERRTKSEVER